MSPYLFEPLTPNADLSGMERTVKKPKLGVFVWNRLRATRCNLKPLVITEVLSPKSMRVLRVLLESNPDLDELRGNGERVEKLKRYLTLMTRSNGERVVKFEQTNISAFAPSSYKGSTRVGRAYSSSYLIQIPSRILNTMLRDSHINIDIRSSYWTMLGHLYSHLDIPFVKKYVVNREEILEAYREGGVEDYAKIKRMISASLSSYPIVPSSYGLDPQSDMDIIRNFEMNEWTHQLRSDLDSMAEEMKSLYPHFVEAVVGMQSIKGKGDTAIGYALSLQAGDMEHSVMRLVLDHLLEEMRDIVWKYDGVLVPTASVVDVDGLEAALEQLVLDEFGFRVIFKVGPLQPSIVVALPPGELIDSPYDEFKRDFEKTHGKILNPPSFFRIDGYDIQYNMSEDKFKLATKEYPKEFLKTWWEDPYKRMYEKIDCLPPPLECPDDVMNTFRGIAASRLPENDSPVDLQVFMNHVVILMGGDLRCAEYFHKMMARKVQFPGAKLGVMIYIQSVQGTGKDALFNIITKLFGSYNVCTVGDFGGLTGFNSYHLEGKLFACISEATHAGWKECQGTVRALVTNPTFESEKKNVNRTHKINTADLIVATNDWNAINVTADDRRLFSVTAKGEHANDPKYFKPLWSWAESQCCIRGLYDFYMGMDVDDFIPYEHRIITDTMKDMVANSESVFDRLLIKKLDGWIETYPYGDGLVRLTAKEVTEQFRELVEKMQLKNLSSSQAATKFLARQFGEAQARMDKHKKSDFFAMKRTRSKDTRYYIFNVAVVRRYLKQFEAVFTEEG